MRVPKSSKSIIVIISWEYGGVLGRALTLLAQKLEPEVQSVSMPHRIVRSEADLDALLTEVKSSVLDKLTRGPVQF
jgi:hypothetical protein